MEAKVEVQRVQASDGGHLPCHSQFDEAKKTLSHRELLGPGRK
jgi:hypothetical protein